MNKLFKMIDDAFICEVCKREVKPLGYTARDHCPYCLHSKHIDINPGDRLNKCGGILKPIGIEKHKTNSFKIIYECDRCKTIKKNIMAIDDDYDLIIRLSTLENQKKE